MMKKFLFLFLLVCSAGAAFAQSQPNVIDEVVWVVGDDAILLSDIENQRLYLQSEGQRFENDPYCYIPEQIAIQKLFLNQAKIDSIEANEASVIQQVDYWINSAVSSIGDVEKVEEYFGKKISQIKEERKSIIREQEIIKQVRSKLAGEIKLTPSEVRKYYNQLSQDSLPTIPTTVEVQIITLEPKIPLEEIDAIKARLREYTDDIHSGRRPFSTLARLYSEDPGSSMQGGEMGFMSKTSLVPEFANVAFNLTDPNRVSQIVQTEYGYHIIQLIEKRGDRINVRHLLLRPKVSEKELNEAMVKMDSLYNDIKAEKFTFEEAATYLSYDKDSKNNKGLMVNQDYESAHMGTPRFEMFELPQEMARVVNEMEVGDISKPFIMRTQKEQKEVIAIVKLKARTLQHKANISDDYQVLKSIVEESKREEMLHKWIQEKQRSTYIRISDGWQNCDFQYPGWVRK
ncbi:peptidyl-prolyl cis-trans isomerase SurA [Parabacteroides sp. PFB2-12]|uniref:peptidylprolyl isomerase n=1 Tax=unclassified Parabacteroides TaxID=2649774 RepID=UPI002474423E|nr:MULTISPECIES: peptidylprolyl isomerase [unclassified Parabacteroides]MDH6342567.1 peptidyl-prolyl cis-trans isomerase SurA [Parabacteroides sp. PM6-13]MDH6390219.1 peptidyl-prolyl cis-trans isomerase SurA [Parabacteroides sp. PFB2-12]